MPELRTLGLSISANNPLILGGGFNQDLTGKAETYTHNISLDWGFDTAQIKLKVSIPEIAEWIEHGLMRDIVVYGDAGQVVWQGFVNQINAVLGGLAIVRGPATDLANRVGVIYSILDTTVDPPVSGNETRTILVEDTDSQDKYGSWEKWLNVQNCSDTEAEQIRDTFLADCKYPKTSHTLTLPETSGDISLSLDLLGYSHLTEYYNYNNTSLVSATLSEKIIDVLTAQPDSLLSNQAGIESNPFLTVDFDNEERTAASIIKNLVAYGDASDNRWFWGVYEDRKSVYQVVSSEIDFVYRASRGLVQTVAGGLVSPWDVRPGKWVLNGDLLPGRNIEANLRADPRCMLIENVTFTAPFGLQLSGGRWDKLSQMVAKKTGSGAY